MCYSCGSENKDIHCKICEEKLKPGEPEVELLCFLQHGHVACKGCNEKFQALDYEIHI